MVCKFKFFYFIHFSLTLFFILFMVCRFILLYYFNKLYVKIKTKMLGDL